MPSREGAAEAKAEAAAEEATAKAQQPTAEEREAARAEIEQRERARFEEMMQGQLEKAHVALAATLQSQWAAKEESMNKMLQHLSQKAEEAEARALKAEEALRQQGAGLAAPDAEVEPPPPPPPPRRREQQQEPQQQPAPPPSAAAPEAAEEY